MFAVEAGCVGCRIDGSAALAVATGAATASTAAAAATAGKRVRRDIVVNLLVRPATGAVAAAA
jgi:hypothetical protein